MALLVHITAENIARRLARNGIAPVHGYVWAFPVLESYTLTHSWSRELKRMGRTALAAITFRVPDEEVVLAAHYREDRREMTAAEAVGLIRSRPDPRGYEILLPRRVAPGEIARVRVLPRAVGWRYFPEAKGKTPWMCDCPVCSPRGEVKASRQRARVAERLPPGSRRPQGRGLARRGRWVAPGAQSPLCEAVADWFGLGSRGRPLQQAHLSLRAGGRTPIMFPRQVTEPVERRAGPELRRAGLR